MLLLRGATNFIVVNKTLIRVSIHAPLARSNFLVFYACFSHGAFQYMLLLRGATKPEKSGHKADIVTIHSPLARSNIPFSPSE